MSSQGNGGVAACPVSSISGKTGTAIAQLPRSLMLSRTDHTGSQAEDFFYEGIPTADGLIGEMLDALRPFRLLLENGHPRR
jgi:hypothetical protein